MQGERFSDVCKEFLREIVKGADDVKRKVLSVLQSAAEPLKSFRTLVTGEIVPHFQVTLGGLKDVVSSDLRGDAAILARALDKEIQARGANWANEGAHLAVKDLLTDPLAKHVAELDKPALPAAPTMQQLVDATVAKITPSVPTLADVKQAAAQAVAEHVATNPLPAPAAPPAV